MVYFLFDLRAELRLMIRGEISGEYGGRRGRLLKMEVMLVMLRIPFIWGRMLKSTIMKSNSTDGARSYKLELHIFALSKSNHVSQHISDLVFRKLVARIYTLVTRTHRPFPATRFQQRIPFKIYFPLNPKHDTKDIHN